MNEKAFLKALADEVRQAGDTRLAAVVAWCEVLNAHIGACGGVEADQCANAAATGAMLISEMNMIEETGESIDPHCDINSFNRKDIRTPKYFFRPDFDARIIRLSATVVDMETDRRLMGYLIGDLLVEMRTLPEGVGSVKSASGIIVES